MRTQLDDLRLRLKKLELRIKGMEREGRNGNLKTYLQNERFKLIDTINNIH